MKKNLADRGEIDLNTAARIYSCTVGKIQGGIDLKSPMFYALQDELPRDSAPNDYWKLWTRAACLARIRILTALQWYEEAGCRS